MLCKRATNEVGQAYDLINGEVAIDLLDCLLHLWDEGFRRPSKTHDKVFERSGNLRVWIVDHRSHLLGDSPILRIFHDADDFNVLLWPVRCA